MDCCIPLFLIGWCVESSLNNSAFNVNGGVCVSGGRECVDVCLYLRSVDELKRGVIVQSVDLQERIRFTEEVLKVQTQSSLQTPETQSGHPVWSCSYWLYMQRPLVFVHSLFPNQHRLDIKDGRSHQMVCGHFGSLSLELLLSHVGLLELKWARG